MPQYSYPVRIELSVAAPGLDALIDEIIVLRGDGELVHARACDIQPDVIAEIGDGSKEH